jgi:hypothetical protein
VAPLRLGGLRGKQSTPSDWLGGTGEVSTVGERGAARSVGSDTERGMSSEASEGKRYDFISGRVDCPVIYFGDYDVLL